MAPVLREIRMLEEHDVIVGARSGDSVPDARQRVVAILGVKPDLEDTLFIGVADAGLPQR